MWQSGRLSSARPSELEAKSLALQDKLAAYHSDPRMDKMRQQREALPVTAKATDILAKIEVNDVTIVMAADRVPARRRRSPSCCLTITSTAAREQSATSSAHSLVHSQPCRWPSASRMSG